MKKKTQEEEKSAQSQSPEISDLDLLPDKD